MALVPMQKIAVLCARDRADDVLRFLQQYGVLEISQGDEVPKEYQELDSRRGPVARAEVEAAYQKAQIDFALSTLTPHASDRIKKQKLPKDQRAIEQTAVTGEFQGIVEQVSKIEPAFTDLDRKEQELQNEYDMLFPWRHYPYRGDPLRNIPSVDLALGIVPVGQVPGLTQELEQKKVYAEISSTQRDDQEYILAYVWHEHRKRFNEIVTEYGWSNANVTLPWRETPKERIDAIKKEQADISHERETLCDKLRGLAKHVPHLQKAYQYFSWLEEEQQARGHMKYSSTTAVLFGWVPKATVCQLTNDLSRRVSASEIILVSPRDDEEPPVLLRHSMLFRPFVGVTELYGLPKPNEFDPTPLLAPFFILFFALCLTDAGYGLVLSLLFGGAILFTKKRMVDSPLLWLLLFGGIVTFLVGIPFGGWLGLTPDRVPEALTVVTADGERMFLGQVWNLSTPMGVTFLQNVAIVLGIIHLSFGMFLAGWHKWIHGKKEAALWQDFTSHLLIASGIGIFIVPEQWSRYAQFVLVTAVLLFVWGKGYGQTWYLRPIFGIMGLANFAMSMLSNLISYLRLLALGLVTGAIALAVNEVAGEVGALLPTVLAVPAVVALFLAGHTISIALNALGSFVHSARLQFIEFFLQFFEGGGREFRPFRRTIS